MKILTNTIRDTLKYINTTQVLRTGPVPDSLEDLPFDVTDIDSVLADEDSRATNTVISYSYKASPLNAYTQIKDHPVSSINGLWSVPAYLINQSIDTELSRYGNFQGLTKTESGQYLYQFEDKYIGSAPPGYYQGMYLNSYLEIEGHLPRSTAISRFYKPTSITAIMFSSYRANGSDRGPNRVEIEYENAETGEWETFLLGLSNVNTNAESNWNLSFGKITYYKSWSGSSCRRYITVVLNTPVMATAVRIRRVSGSTSGYIQGLDAYSSEPKTELKGSDITHLIVYPWRVGSVELDPILIKLDSDFEYTNKDEVLANTKPDWSSSLGSSLGSSSGKSRLTSKSQIDLFKYYFQVFVSNAPDLALAFFEADEVPDPEALMTLFAGTSSSFLTSKMFSEIKKLGHEPIRFLATDMSNAGSSAPLITSGDTFIECVYRTGEFRTTDFSVVPTGGEYRKTGTIKYAIMYGSSKSGSEAFTYNATLRWFTVVSVGLKGSGADIELEDVTVTNTNAVFPQIEKDVKLRFDFS